MRWIHGLALAALLGGAAARAAEDVPTGPLPRDVVPTLVQLDLRIDPREERFSGHTRIEATLARPLRTLWLHGRDLEITRAEVQVVAIKTSGGVARMPRELMALLK